MKNDLTTTHVGRIALVVLAVLLGGIVGFYYGAAQEYANFNEDNTTSFVTSLTKHKMATSTASPTSTSTTSATKLYSSTTLGLSFRYPSTATVSVISSSIGDNLGGNEVLRVTAADFTAKIYLAKTGASGADSGSNVIGLFRRNQISDANQVSLATSVTAQNFSFKLLDVNADPAYVSAFADLTNKLLDVSFSSLNGGASMTAYHQTQVPQDARDFLTSFSKL